MTASTYPTLKDESKCVTGKCMSFDGNDYIQVVESNVSTSPLAITGAMTLSSWVKFNVLGTTRTIITRGFMAGDGNYGYGLGTHSADNNRIRFVIYAPNGSWVILHSLKTLDTNWHLITATWDGTMNENGMKMYIDGVLDNQRASTVSTIGQPNHTFKIGRNNSSLDGLIDDVRVYNGAISASQIKQEYIAGLNSLIANNNISKEEYDQRLNSLSFK